MQRYAAGEYIVYPFTSTPVTECACSLFDRFGNVSLRVSHGLLHVQNGPADIHADLAFCRFYLTIQLAITRNRQRSLSSLLSPTQGKPLHSSCPP